MEMEGEGEGRGREGGGGREGEREGGGGREGEGGGGRKDGEEGWGGWGMEGGLEEGPCGTLHSNTVLDIFGCDPPLPSMTMTAPNIYFESIPLIISGKSHLQSSVLNLRKWD